jgi:hypothetical protein
VSFLGSGNVMSRLQFQDEAHSRDERRAFSAQDDKIITTPVPPCILLAGESLSLQSLRARILEAADMLTSIATPKEAPGVLMSSFHHAVVICHTASAEDARKIIDAAYEQRRRTRTLLLTRIPHYVPPALNDCHVDDVYCWYEGVPVFVSKLRRLVELPDYQA